MQHFTGYEYLQIDVANAFGLDKKLFPQRIAWATEHLDHLESLAEQAETPELYTKAVMALRDAEAGKAIGHRVGLDAICSGIQVMSALTGCEAGAKATGLIDTGIRPDAYTTVTDTMNQILHSEGIKVDIPRKDAKQATMTSFYGSRKTPKDIFGVDTPELSAFYMAIQSVAPGAWELLQELLGSWQPFALMHRWVLPDGFVARVKVMEKVEKRLEIDELDHATFTYEWYENTGTESGLSNVANVVHSVDAYLLRSLIRRCNYDPAATSWAIQYVFTELMQRDVYDQVALHPCGAPDEFQKYVERFEATNMVDAVIIPYLDAWTVRFLSTDHLRRLNVMMEEMLDHATFPIVSIHDDFTAHPNNLNVLRQQYINIFAEMAESTILDDIFQTLTGMQGHYTKLSHNLSQQIRQAEYPLG